MCVLICRVGDAPLLAANRDEVYARPFTGPKRWVAETPFWAPRDEEEGGTWIGVNRAGLVAGITNRSTLPARAGLASRGHLITGILARPDADAALAWLHEELARAPRNPCQVFWMHGPRAFVCRVDGEGFATRELPAGFHVLSNLHEPDEIDFGLAPDAGWDAIRPILADSTGRLPRGYAVCKRAGWRGTVASALIEPGKRFLFAGGPPDEVEYEPVEDYPLRTDRYTLDRMLRHLRWIEEVGLERAIAALPAAARARIGAGASDAELLLQGRLLEAMTPAERRDPDRLGPEARHRIVEQAGARPEDLAELLRTFELLRAAVPRGWEDPLGPMA